MVIASAVMRRNGFLLVRLARPNGIERRSRVVYGALDACRSRFAWSHGWVLWSLVDYGEAIVWVVDWVVVGGLIMPIGSAQGRKQLEASIAVPACGRMVCGSTCSYDSRWCSLFTVETYKPRFGAGQFVQELQFEYEAWRGNLSNL